MSRSMSCQQFSSQTVPSRFVRGSILDRTMIKNQNQKPDFARHVRCADTVFAVSRKCRRVELVMAEPSEEAGEEAGEEPVAATSTHVRQLTEHVKLSDLCEQLADSNHVQTECLQAGGSVSHWRQRPIAKAKLHLGRPATQTTRMGVKVQAWR